MTTGPAPLPALPPELHAGDGVVLRGYRTPGEDGFREDVEAVLAMAAETEFQRWTTVPVPYRREDAEHFLAEVVPSGWARQTTLTWAVEADGAHAGNVSLRLDDAGSAEVGFGLDAGSRGRGVMARSLRALMAWAVEHGTEVLHWRAQVGNWASRRVAWSCGFRVEGTVRGLLAQRGELRDAWVASWRAGDPVHPVTPWFDAPRVDLGTVVLRPWRLADAPRALEACTDPLTQRWLPMLPSPYTEADARAFITSRELEHAEGREICWAAADPASDAVLASVSLFRLNTPTTAEIGYWAHPDARGRGVVTTAVRAAARHALLPVEDGGLGRAAVMVRAEPANTASVAVARRLGFSPAGQDVGLGGMDPGTGGRPWVDLDRYVLRAQELARLG